MELTDIMTAAISALGVSGLSSLILLASIKRRLLGFLNRSKVPMTLIADKDRLAEIEDLAGVLKADGITEVEISCRHEAAVGARLVVLYAPKAEEADEIITGIRDFAPRAMVLVMYRGRLELSGENFKAIHMSNSDLRLWGDIQAAASRIGAEL